MLYATWIARQAHSSDLLLLVTLSVLTESPINGLLNVPGLMQKPSMTCFLPFRLGGLKFCGLPNFKDPLISMMH